MFVRRGATERASHPLSPVAAALLAFGAIASIPRIAQTPAIAHASSPSGKQLLIQSLGAMRSVHSLHADGTSTADPIAGKRAGMTIAADCSTPAGSVPGSTIVLQKARSRSTVDGTLLGEGQHGVKVIPFHAHFVQFGYGRSSSFWERSGRTANRWKQRTWREDDDVFSFIPFACPLLANLASLSSIPAVINSGQVRLKGKYAWHLSMHTGTGARRSSFDYWIDVASSQWLRSQISPTGGPANWRITFDYSRLNVPVVINRPTS